MSTGIMRKSPDGISWQDYRASNTGMVVFYTSDPVSEMTIREAPEELSSPVTPEPNYETATYGFFGCDKAKIRTAFVKSKVRFMFFLTKYAGAKEELKDKLLVTGYYRIAKTADVQKLHLRYLDDSSCIDAPSCFALRADEVHFVALKDAFLVTDDQLKKWGYNAKVSRQLRIILSPEDTSQLLAALKDKTNELPAYIAETKRLSPEDEGSEIDEDADEKTQVQIREATVFSTPEEQPSSSSTPENEKPADPSV